MVKHIAREMENGLSERLAARGFRFTPQREHVYRVLLRERDHPTAEQVFMRAKRIRPEISMATVYNCLDALVKCRLVREVNVNPTAMRYCPNMQDHHHFYCDQCGSVFDLDPSLNGHEAGLKLPKGFAVTRYDISVHGACARCAARDSAARC